MVVTTLVLSIISAILAGILTLIQIVELFGLPRHECFPCSAIPTNSTQPFNSTLPMLKPEEGFNDEGCCPRPADHDHHQEEGDWGPDTLVYLILGLLMLALAIYSATIACLAKEERLPGMVWTQGEKAWRRLHLMYPYHQVVGLIQDKAKELPGPPQDQDGSSHQVAFHPL